MLIVVAIIAMFFQDVLGTLKIVATTKGRGWLAGICDGLMDFGALLGAGIAGATLTKHGFGAEFILVSMVAATSVFSTAFATKLSEKIKSTQDLASLAEFASSPSVQDGELDHSQSAKPDQN